MTRSIGGWLGWVILGLLLAIALTAGAAGTAQAQGSGVLEGRVVNGTAGGPPVGAGITVTLHVMEGENELSTIQAPTQPGGAFRFEGLDTGLDRAYWVEVTYLGVSYGLTDTVQFAAGQEALSVEIAAYETTADAGQLSLDSGHLIAESLGPILRVSELYLVGNRGDRTYVGQAGAGGPATTTRIALPDGAVGLGFGEGTPPDRFVQSEALLLDTRPVPPGQEQVMIFFSYHLPITDGVSILSRSYDYPVTTLNVLLAQPGLALQSAQLQAQGPQFFENRQYDVFAATNLPAGMPLNVSLTVNPVEESQPAATGEAGVPVKDSQGVLGWLGLGIALAAVIGAVAYPLATSRRAAPAALGRPLTAEPRARRLLAELADLEDAFEAGRVDEDTYRRQKAEKQEAVRSLWP